MTRLLIVASLLLETVGNTLVFFDHGIISTVGGGISMLLGIVPGAYRFAERLLLHTADNPAEMLAELIGKR